MQSLLFFFFRMTVLGIFSWNKYLLAAVGGRGLLLPWALRVHGGSRQLWHKQLRLLQRS